MHFSQITFISLHLVVLQSQYNSVFQWNLHTGKESFKAHNGEWQITGGRVAPA